MKITVATFSAILFVSGFSPLAHAQAQIAVPGVGEVTIGQPPPPPPPPGYGRAPEYAEHCEHLGHKEHELRERVAYMPYGPERARLEQQLQEVHQERDQCWRR